MESSALPKPCRTRAAAYAIPGEQVDGNNVVAVYRAPGATAEYVPARAKGQPCRSASPIAFGGHTRFEQYVITYSFSCVLLGARLVTHTVIAG